MGGKQLKYKIIDWVGGYDNFPPAGELSFAKRNYLVEEIRREGYLFSGEDHQEEYPCVPVFNDGTRYETSRRGWGRIMADANGRYGLYDYSLFTENFSIPREERSYPSPAGVSPTDEDWDVFIANNCDGPDPFDMAMERYNKTLQAFDRGEEVLYPGATRREELAETYDLTAESRAQYDEFRAGKPLVYIVPENSDFCHSLRYLDADDTVRLTYGDASESRIVKDVDYRKIYTDEDAEGYKALYVTDPDEANQRWLSLDIKITITLK